ncbi:MAG: flavin reductase family protein [Chloroflexi bacterium]|nr:flavin reductase family protein [Chloroflexota bacterium]
MKFDMANLDRNQIHDLLLSGMAPLPVVLVSTVGKNGSYNAAPYSLVFPVCYKPPIICVSCGLRKGQKKDTARNIESAKDFVLNIMDETHLKPTVQASADYPADVDEMKEVGLTAVPCDRVKSPRVAEAQVSLECKLVQRMELGKGDAFRNIYFGEVLLAHIKDELWAGHKVEPSKLKSVGYVGNETYCRLREFFTEKASELKP